MKQHPTLLALLLALIFSFTSGVYPAETVYPGVRWLKAVSPEPHGWSSVKLARAEAFSRQIGSAAVMVVENGTVMAAWGPVSHRYPLHSIRKPLMSALVGIHVAQGNIDLSRSLEDFGIDDYAPGLTALEKQATLADLMTSRSGVYHPALGEVAAMKQARPQRGSHRPGAFWYYNNWDFNAVGTIFEQETGTRVFEAFAEQVAKPLQMEDFSARDGTYITGPASIHRVYAMRMSTRDLARFGLLYLRHGRWRGRPIVPSAWVEKSTATHSDIGRGRGYGLMWRTAVEGGLLPNVLLPARCFFHSGAGLHFLIVLPRFDLVLVHRVDTYTQGPFRRPQQIGRLVWMILDARGIRDIGPDPSLESAARPSLAGRRLFTTLTAQTLDVFIPNGLVEGGDRTYLAEFIADGTMRLKTANRQAVNGRWGVKQNRCCVDIDGLKACFAVVDTQNEIRFYDQTNTLYTAGRK